MFSCVRVCVCVRRVARWGGPPFHVRERILAGTGGSSSLVPATPGGDLSPDGAEHDAPSPLREGPVHAGGVHPENPLLLFADGDRHGSTTSLVLRNPTVGLPPHVHFQRVNRSILPTRLLDGDSACFDIVAQCGRLVLPTVITVETCFWRTLTLVTTRVTVWPAESWPEDGGIEFGFCFRICLLCRRSAPEVHSR